MAASAETVKGKHFRHSQCGGQAQGGTAFCGDECRSTIGSERSRTAPESFAVGRSIESFKIDRNERPSGSRQRFIRQHQMASTSRTTRRKISTMERRASALTCSCGGDRGVC